MNGWGYNGLHVLDGARNAKEGQMDRVGGGRGR